MTWKPVVVGVDASPEGALAASTGWVLAQATRAHLHLVHAAREPVSLAHARQQPSEQDRLRLQVIAGARAAVEKALQPVLPAEAMTHLEIRVGNPAWILRQAAAEYGAGVLLLGGKHHAAPVRWLGGSTVHSAVRTIDLPLFVAAAALSTISQILVATDLSDAARITLETALAYAAPFNATVRVLHVVEPLPSIPDVGIELNEQEHFRLAEHTMHELLATIAPGRTFELVVRAGAPARTITEEAAASGATLVVVGSHGKGWVDRVLLGSTTERLLNRLPASVLVVPVGNPSAPS